MPNTASTKFCPNCGTPASSDQMYCLNCGTILSTPTESKKHWFDKFKFVRIKEGKWIGGVCTGLSKIWNVNVYIIRAVGILLAPCLVWVALYLMAMTFLPIEDC